MRALRWSMSLAAIALVVVAPVLPQAQADLPIAKAETVGMSSKRLERINAVHQGLHRPQPDCRRRDAGRAQGQDRALRGAGLRYKEENQPMEKDAIFSLMSMTKPIVSTALMMLWEDGSSCSTTRSQSGCRRTRTRMVRIR